MVITKLPDSARPRYPAVEFESDTLDGQGEYNFGVAANVDKLLMDNLSPGSLYHVAAISFYAAALEGDWLKSMISKDEFPRVTVRLIPGKARSWFADPFRCVNYVDNLDQVIWLPPVQKGDTLVASMYGRVRQVAGMVGESTLKAQFNMAVYEVDAAQWLQTFRENPKHSGSTWRL